MHSAGKPELNPGDFMLTFETNGVSLLFQESACVSYMPPDSLEVMSEGGVRAYIALDRIRLMNEEGKNLYDNEGKIQNAIARMDGLLDEADALLGNHPDGIAPAEAERIFALVDGINEAYSIFDFAYTDGAYEAAGGMTPALSLAEANKNRLRARYDTHFFSDTGVFMAPLLGAVARMRAVPAGDLLWCLRDEIFRILNGEGIPYARIQERKRGYAFYKDEAGTRFFEGSDAIELRKLFEPVVSSSPSSRIQGIIANAGPAVQGRVTIINSDYDNQERVRGKIAGMERGDVLVSVTTAPDLMEACRKASAIVTDLGGMLSHAAITARELGIPCIIGTKNASRILKNGDLVEVDSEEGIVSILERI